jgi:hypothetical protein
MTSLKELTDIQLERKLTRLYDLGKDKEISLIEDEQKLRYSNWEKQLLKQIKTVKKVDEQHIYIGEYKGKEYKQIRTFTDKGSRTKFYVDCMEVTKEKRNEASEIIYHLKINNKIKQK